VVVVVDPQTIIRLAVVAVQADFYLAQQHGHLEILYQLLLAVVAVVVLALLVLPVAMARLLLDLRLQLAVVVLVRITQTHQVVAQVVAVV
jgi:hypothetical protein